MKCYWVIMRKVELGEMEVRGDPLVWPENLPPIPETTNDRELEIRP